VKEEVFDLMGIIKWLRGRIEEVIRQLTLLQ
jgi:hypothetical protein